MQKVLFIIKTRKEGVYEHKAPKTILRMEYQSE